MLTNTFAKIKFKCLSSFLDSLSPSRYSFLHLTIINQDDLFRRYTAPPLYHPHNLRSKIVYFLLNTDAPSSSLPGDAARLTAKGFVSTLKVPVGRTHPCCHIAKLAPITPKEGTTPTFPLSYIRCQRNTDCHCVGVSGPLQSICRPRYIFSYTFWKLWPTVFRFQLFVS